MKLLVLPFCWRDGRCTWCCRELHVRYSFMRGQGRRLDMVGQGIACFSFTFQTGSFDPSIHMAGVVQMTWMPTTATTQVVEVVAWVVPRHFHRLLQRKNNK